MTTAMRERKGTNKLKIATAGILSAGVIGAGSFVYGVSTTKATSADTTQKAVAAAEDNAVNGAQVVNALDNYQVQHGIPAGTDKISKLEIKDTAYARGKLLNGDSGANFYAKNVQGSWSIVVVTQSGLTQAQATQFGLPGEWVGQNSWGN